MPLFLLPVFWFGYFDGFKTGSRVSSEIFSFLDRKGRISRSPSTRKQLCKRGHLHEGMSSFFFPLRWRTTPWRFFYGNRNPPVFRRFAHRVPAALTLPFFFGNDDLGQVVAIFSAQDATPPPVFPELAEPAVGRAVCVAANTVDHDVVPIFHRTDSFPCPGKTKSGPDLPYPGKSEPLCISAQKGQLLDDTGFDQRGSLTRSSVTMCWIPACSLERYPFIKVGNALCWSSSAMGSQHMGCRLSSCCVPLGFMAK